MSHPGPRWKLYHRTSDAWQAMLDSCREAKKSIYFEQYLFQDTYKGEIGREFLEVFIERGRAGLDVRVLLDGVGSVWMLGSRWPQRLREAGVEVKFFALKSKFSLGNFIPGILRTHRKIAVIDDKHSYVGGVIQMQSYKDTRDTQLYLKDAEVGRCLREAFISLWKEIDTAWFTVADTISPCSSSSGFEVRANAPGRKKSFIYRNLLMRVRQACERVTIVTPYFSPTTKLYMAMKRAVEHGCEVRLLLPLQSDRQVADMAAQASFTAFLKAGVDIYLYPEAMHAKIFLVDQWASVGSCNADVLSFVLNHELNVASENHRFVTDVRNQVSEDIKKSHQLTRAEWDGAGVWDTLRAIAGRFFRPIV